MDAVRTLRSGKLYESGVRDPSEEELQPPTGTEKEAEKELEAEAEKEKESEAETGRKSSLNHASQPYVSPIPYPQRLQKVQPATGLGSCPVRPNNPNNSNYSCPLRLKVWTL